MHYSGAPVNRITTTNRDVLPRRHSHNAPTPVRKRNTVDLQVFSRYHPRSHYHLFRGNLETVLGTTGDDTLSTDLLKDFVVDGLAGDDTITIEESASAFQVQSRAGSDSLTANGAVTNADKVKTGADDDALTFKGAVTNSSVYAGKGTDTLTFERTVSGGLVSGDTGNDTIDITGKISASAVSGGADATASFCAIS